MKIQPVASPHAISQTQSTGNGPTYQDKRAAAIAKLTAPPAQPVVQNQTAIAPEEMSAIKPSSGQADQIEATEAPLVEEQQPKKAEVDPALSRQFAQIARQEKAMRAKAFQQEQAWKAKEAAIAAREAEIATLEAKYKSGYVPADQIKQNTLKVLAEAGVSYDELTQQILNQSSTDPRVEATISRLEAKIQQLERQEEQNRKAAQDQQSAAYQAAVKQIKTDVTNLVNTDPAFEVIKATKSINDVVELIEQVYQKDGVLLSVEDAAQQVEDYLMEEALGITKIDKIKNKLGIRPVQAASQAKTQSPSSSQQQPQPTMKTLTNNTASNRQLSRRERALLAFKGELKS